MYDMNNLKKLGALANNPKKRNGSFSSFRPSRFNRRCRRGTWNSFNGLI